MCELCVVLCDYVLQEMSVSVWSLPGSVPPPIPPPRGEEEKEEESSSEEEEFKGKNLIGTVNQRLYKMIE